MLVTITQKKIPSYGFSKRGAPHKNTLMPSTKVSTEHYEHCSLQRSRISGIFDSIEPYKLRLAEVLFKGEEKKEVYVFWL